jgi:hypothetical protein
MIDSDPPAVAHAHQRAFFADFMNLVLDPIDSRSWNTYDTCVDIGEVAHDFL